MAEDMISDSDLNRQREAEAKRREEERRQLVKGMTPGADEQVGQGVQDLAQIESSKNMKRDMIGRYKTRLGDRASDVILTGNESLEELTRILEDLKSR